MEEGHALRRIVDLIIPTDDEIPGAAALGVHEFIDSYWDQVASKSKKPSTGSFGICRFGCTVSDHVQQTFGTDRKTRRL